MAAAQPRTNRVTAADLLASDAHLQRLVHLLQGYEPERIILFGSRARGAADEYSDYDVVVITCTDRPFIDRLRDVVPYLVEFGRAADVLVYTPEEFDRMRNIGLGWIIHQEGVVLYERHPD
ncbi:MAG: nucleotidyltransferase domain-containing protein [Chloroflexota bacterium]